MLKKKKKVIIINPPINQTDTVYSAVPLLLGQIKDLKDVEARALDLNIEFLYDLISKHNLLETEKKLQKIYKNNEKIIFSGEINKKAVEQNRLIKKYYLDNRELFKKLIKMADSLIPEFMQNFSAGVKDKSEQISKYIKYALTLCLLPYYPQKGIINLKGYPFIFIDNDYKYSYEDIMQKISDRNQNIFVDYFEQKIKSLKLKEYDVIAITIPFTDNLYPVFTFCRLLKEHTKAKILIGGVLVHVIQYVMSKYPDMFDKFFDIVIYGEGELSFRKYIRYIANEIPLSEVSGIIYKQDNVIKKLPIEEIKDITDIKNYCFDGIDFSKYSGRKINVEFSKGCYWGKCSYCYSRFHKRYHIKTPEKAVDMLEEFVKKYKVTTFSILDDALSPAFAEKFADEIIKRNLKITYTCLMRAEEIITFDFLKKLKQSGLKSVFWGVESASERILSLMNKGIDIEVVKRIIKDAYSLGIENIIGIMFGFPTETKEDAIKTIAFIKENRKYFTKVNPFRFVLLKKSALLENPELYQMTNIREVEEFSNYYLYDSPNISTKWLNQELIKNNLKEFQVYSKWE